MNIPFHKLADDIYDVTSAYADKYTAGVERCREDIIISLIYNIMSEVDCKEELDDVFRHMQSIYDGQAEQKKKAMN